MLCISLTDKKIINNKTFENMKKNYVYALMSAVALAGAVSLSACSSSDDVVDVNPTYDGEAVKTQFTISFTQSVAKTRQTAATVQTTADGGNITISGFRGMDNIVLYPFAATAVAGADPITSSSTKIGDKISLTSMIQPAQPSNYEANTIPAGTSGLTTASNSVLFGDVTIPIGTGSFLFYGKAIDNTTYTDKFYNGSLKLINTTASNATPDAPNPANIAFDLEQIYPSSTTASTVGAALADYLSQIAQAGGFDSSTKKSAWEATDNTGLKDLYAKFITLKAGSSLNVQAAVQDLYTSIKNNTDDVSIAIKNAILSTTTTAITYSTKYATDENSDGTLEFQANIGNSAATYFPGDKNLPDGAALLAYDDDTNTFSQSEDGVGNTGNNAEYADYVYPASLYYYCNSGIKTSTSSQQTLYNGTNTWAQITGNAAYAGNAVGPSSRSVAILDPIQYGVGRLDMKIKKLNTETVGGKPVMYDKKGEPYDVTNGFTVTGVLIGGQKQVGFNFEPNGTTEKTIYDNITKSQTGTTLTVDKENASATNYTLALETASNSEIYVAVEFLNNGADFEGADGVIPAGCKFYLVGKLDPTTEGTYDETNTATGVSSTGNKVFKQDYKTIADFSIAKGTANTANTKGLAAAYNTVPDLRTPQLELGFSVDLTWNPGITFDVEF